MRQGLGIWPERLHSLDLIPGHCIYIYIYINSPTSNGWKKGLPWIWILYSHSFIDWFYWHLKWFTVWFDQLGCFLDPPSHLSKVAPITLAPCFPGKWPPEKETPPWQQRRNLQFHCDICSHKIPCTFVVGLGSLACTEMGRWHDITFCDSTENASWLSNTQDISRPHEVLRHLNSSSTWDFLRSRAETRDHWRDSFLPNIPKLRISRKDHSKNMQQS